MHTSISKKLLAGLLSVVMVLSLFAAVPANNAQAASLSLTGNTTVSAGVTNTYKILNMAKTQYAKVSVSNKNVTVKKGTATVKATTKIAGTGKAIALKANAKAAVAGKSYTLTVKVYNKKTNKVVKTLKKVVKVYNKTTAVALDKTSAELIPGETVTLKATTTPAKNTRPVTWASDNTAVATVKGGVVTAVAEGTATITAKSNGKTATATITVVKAENGLTATLSNPFSSTYPNTVLVNSNAVVRVRVLENGKAVANQSVVLNLGKRTGAGANYYDVKGMNVAVTDSEGYASFVIGNVDPTVKANDKTKVASVNYTATLAADGTAVNGQVDFAAVSLTYVTNVNDHDADDTNDLVPGTNATEVGASAIAKMASMENPTADNNEYVASQQVSVTGSDAHKVIFKGGYPVITLPGSGTDLSAAQKKVEEVNYTSDKYHTYANNPYVTDYKLVTLTEDISKLTYATVGFKNVKLSKETELVVETWNTEDGAKKGALYGDLVDRKVYSGAMSSENFGYQVPLKANFARNENWVVKVYVRAAGQVDTAMNDGYSIKDITYVFKTQTGTVGQTIPVQNAKVNWSIVETPYTAEADLAQAEADYAGYYGAANTTALLGGKTVAQFLKVDKYKVNGIDTAAAKVTYKVPVFPYTGTAIITQYDVNGKVVGYYAIATRNNEKNQNIIDLKAKAYAISSDELRDQAGSIIAQTDTTVTVNATATGRTTLEGKVTVEGKSLAELDAEYDTVFTSVQWNPVPKSGDAAKESKAFVALLGQKIEVYAQLTDVNGNAVKTEGTTVKFFSEKGEILNTATTVSLGAGHGSATIVDKSFTTDSNGQAKLILKSGEITEISGIYAEVAGKKYDVVVKIGKTTVDLADLYWVDADLGFQKTLTSAHDKTTAGAPVVEVNGITPNAGETWEYGVYTTASNRFTKGLLAGDSLYIDGLTIYMSKGSNSVGSFEQVSNGVVNATSTKAGKLYIVSKIGATSVNDKITFYTTKGNAVEYAGVGTTTINKKLTLEVQWKPAGMTAVFVDVAPQYAVSSAAIYLKVTDANGNPVAAGTAVTLKVDNGTITGSTGSSIIVNTDAFGIAKFTINEGTEATTTATATVAGLSGETFTTTVYWVSLADAFTPDLTQNVATGDYDKIVYDKNAGTITIQMTKDVYAASVNKKQFTVKYTTSAGAGGTTTTWAVSAVEVNGNVITLHVPTLDNLDAAGKIAVTFGTATVAGVDYTIMSEEGHVLPNKTLTFVPDVNTSTAPTFN